MRLRADETELLHRLDTFLKANVPAHIDQNSDLWRWGYIERVDVNPVMGYFLVIAITAIVFNFLADLAYAALDPRVRVVA